VTASVPSCPQIRGRRLSDAPIDRGVGDGEESKRRRSSGYTEGRKSIAQARLFWGSSRRQLSRKVRWGLWPGEIDPVRVHPMRTEEADVVALLRADRGATSVPLPTLGQRIGIRRSHGPQATLDVNGQSSRRRPFLDMSGDHMAGGWELVALERQPGSPCLSSTWSPTLHEQPPRCGQSSHFWRSLRSAHEAAPQSRVIQ
jgi:hypothetical protein